MPELKEVFEMVSRKVEPDLDAWREQEWRQRRSARNRKLGAFTLVAAILATAAILALSLPDAVPDDHVGGSLPPRVGGFAPTVARLTGIWLHDGGPDAAEPGMLMEFDADGTFAIDAYASLDTAPATRGTYSVTGRRIDFVVDPSARCPTGETFTFTAGLFADGRLHTVMSEPGCGVTRDTTWFWTRLSPASDAGRRLAAPAPSGDASPPGDVADLEGIWLLQGTGQVLRIGWSGSYAVDDSGTLAPDPLDAGQVDVARRSITFTTGVGARTCHEGDRWVWRRARLEPFSRTLRAIVRSDDCGRGIGPTELVWIRVSGP